MYKLHFFLMIKKSLFFTSYHEICEKNWFPAECVKLCNFLDTKHALSFKKIVEGENKLNINKYFLK